MYKVRIDPLMANSVNVLVEVKGKSYDDTDVKHQATRRWTKAVNHWTRLGQWDFLPCRNPIILQPQSPV